VAFIPKKWMGQIVLAALVAVAEVIVSQTTKTKR
jgi:hypothetical protein